jgi:putative ABC transport system permease protein
MREIRLIVRGLLRTPLFTLTAVVSLALGIGATTAMFSMLDAVLLRTLPVKEPSGLVFLYHPGPSQGSVSTSEPNGPAFSYPMFREMQAQQTAFSALAGSYSVAASMAYHNTASTGSALLVSGNYFEVLGTAAAMGRLFDDHDDRIEGGHPLVVLSHAYWTSRFGADPGVLNQTLNVNGHPMTVVGVAQKGFTGEMPGTTPEIFVPIMMKREMTPDWDAMKDRKDYWVTLFARLKPRTTLEEAATAINVTYRAQLRQDIALLSRPSPDFLRQFEAKKIILRPGTYGRGQIREVGKKPLSLLLGMTLLVLLIACANVANLQLTRALARARETAVRLALGASRRQLVARLLLESSIVALAGAAAGVLVARWTLQGVLAALPPRTFGGLITAALSTRMLLVAMLLAGATSVIFGLYPALEASRAGLTASLRDQSGQTTAKRATSAFRNSLVAFQAAVSLLLLVSAGLFATTLVRLSRVDLGLRTDHLMTFTLTPKLNGYSDDRVRALYAQMQERLAGLPGVASATAARVAVMTSSASSGNMTVEGFTPRTDDDADAFLNEVLPDYFRTLGIPLVAGREFTAADRVGAPKVAIVNEAFVKHFIGTRNPLGVGVLRGGGNNVKFDTFIVGVVKDAHYSAMREPPPPTYYQPYLQGTRQRPLTFYVRTSIDPLQTAGSIRAVVASLDPELPIRNQRTMDAQIESNVASERVLAILTGCFAGLATLLAAIGLYGVLAFNVARRTREIGIRMALGATVPHVRRLVVRDAGVIIGIGLAAGLGAAIVAGRLIASVLFQTSPADPRILASATLVLGLIAIAAAYVPVRRATGVDPVIALRYE